METKIIIWVPGSQETEVRNHIMEIPKLNIIGRLRGLLVIIRLIHL